MRSDEKARFGFVVGVLHTFALQLVQLMHSVSAARLVFCLGGGLAKQQGSHNKEVN